MDRGVPWPQQPLSAAAISLPAPSATTASCPGHTGAGVSFSQALCLLLNPVIWAGTD